MNFKVIFKLDGTGIYYDQNEPIHLDALLAWALAPMQIQDKCLMKNDVPEDIELPLLRETINGSKVWHASALFPDNHDVETLRFWRKKFRQNRIENTSGSPNLTNGIYREYNMPVPLLLIKEMHAYASGNSKEVKKILKDNIKGLGKKHAYGYGKVVDIEVEEISEDLSLIANGVAMRYLPHPDGTRNVRPSPPYWNSIGTVKCMDVGSQWE